MSFRHPLQRTFGRRRLERSWRRRWGQPERASRGPRMRPRKPITERIVPAEAPPARPRIRLRVLAVIGVALFSVMVVRLWYLQVLDTGEYTHAVVAATTRRVEVPAARGLILDRSGTTLVGDEVQQVITLSRQAADDHPQVVGSVASLLGVPASTIQTDLVDPRYSPYEPVPILVNAPLDDVIAIDQHPAAFPGVQVEAITDRSYPLDATDPGNPGSVLWGYLQQTSLPGSGSSLGAVSGASGLEEQYNAALAGRPGVDAVEVNADNQVVDTVPLSRAQAGDDLVTNIDAGLEVVAQNALDAEVAATPGVPGGAVVVMDPQNGQVLAMASNPSYDPSDWVDGQISEADWAPLDENPDDPLLNRAIDGLYTPGSTFKLATATAALQDGLWSTGDTFDDTGSYTVPGCTGPDCTLHDNDNEVNGYIDISQALTLSSDDFFYNLGALFWEQRATYGEDAIQTSANALGFGTVTGIDLPGETDEARVDSPQVVAKEHAQYPQDYPDGEWYTGSNMEMAFGQGGTVITPIDEALAYATFANGGTRYAPEVAAGEVDPATGKVVADFAPKVTGHVTYSPDDYAAILQGLEGVISDPSGTGYPAFVGFPFSTFGQLAGKTGTATVSETGQPDSWFAAFGPVGDPKYVVVAVLQEAGYGATAAAPVVRQIFNYLAANPVGPAQLHVPTTDVSCPPTGSAGSSGSSGSGSASAGSGSGSSGSGSAGSGSGSAGSAGSGSSGSGSGSAGSAGSAGSGSGSASAGSGSSGSGSSGSGSASAGSSGSAGSAGSSGSSGSSGPAASVPTSCAQAAEKITVGGHGSVSAPAADQAAGERPRGAARPA